MHSVRGRVAIITGGAQGIGRATAQRLVADGAAVVIVDVHDRGEQTCALLREAGGDALFVRADISDESEVARMASEAFRHFRRVDYLVNCAAVFIMRGLEATVDDWRRILEVNVMGQALCAKHVWPLMTRSGGGGAIVNVASISAHIAQPGYLTYNATKAALVSMTRCMAMELAPHGIRVNAVNPGTVWTESNERYHRESLGMNRQEAEESPEIGGRHMLHRLADPHEVAAAIVFLLSEDASFITATDLMVDAGYTAM